MDAIAFGGAVRRQGEFFAEGVGREDLQIDGGYRGVAVDLDIGHAGEMADALADRFGEAGGLQVMAVAASGLFAEAQKSDMDMEAIGKQLAHRKRFLMGDIEGDAKAAE